MIENVNSWIQVKEFSNQLQTGQSYQLLNPVIAITFTDFIMFDEFDKYQSNFILQEKETLTQYSDDIELIFIELPKFTKTESELVDIKNKWLYFVKNAGKLDYIPDTLKEPCIEDALGRVNEAAMSQEELELHHRRHDFILLQQGIGIYTNQYEGCVMFPLIITTPSGCAWHPSNGGE